MKLMVAVLMLLTLGAMGEVVQNFTECSGFFLNNEPPEFNDGTASPGRYVRICQRYNNTYHYATLYDTQNRIPVYSAYRYERGSDCNVTRPNKTWMIEPQLEDNNRDAEMALQGHKKINNKQAYNSDYKDSRYDKGHLYPFCHSDSKVAAESTFTLTNSAPQRCDFNKMWYSKVEYEVRKSLDDCVKNKKPAHVVTGVVPNTETLKDNTVSEKQTLKDEGKVNVPSHFWTVFRCCGNNQCQFGGYIMHKEKNEPEVFTTINNFNDRLDQLYQPVTIKVFVEKQAVGAKRPAEVDDAPGGKKTNSNKFG